jgi:ribonuclease HI
MREPVAPQLCVSHYMLCHQSQRTPYMLNAPSPATPSNASSAALVIHIAASCNSSTGRGGWAVYVDREPEPSLHIGRLTNTSAHQLGLAAIAWVLKQAKGKYALRFVTDSAYLVDNFNDRLSGWATTGWTSSAGKFVKHVDTWRAIHEISQRLDVSLSRPSLIDQSGQQAAKRAAQRAARSGGRLAA